MKTKNLILPVLIFSFIIVSFTFSSKELASKSEPQSFNMDVYVDDIAGEIVGAGYHVRLFGPNYFFGAEQTNEYGYAHFWNLPPGEYCIDAEGEGLRGKIKTGYLSSYCTKCVTIVEDGGECELIYPD